ncbi:alkaline phosphatase family protein [bacterium]|nr:alkaline phosphatase family protein [bacterium]
MIRNGHSILKWLVLPAIAAVLLIHPPQAPARDTAVVLPARNIILIGWDGAQRNHVNELLAAGELPNLASLAARGALVEIDIDEKTDTKAGWTQILTGYSAGVTGVYHNGDYQPIPYGYTVFERLNAHCGAENIATLFIAGKDHHVGNCGPAWYELDEAGLPAGVKLVKTARTLLLGGHKRILDRTERLYQPGEPYYYTQHACDVFVNGRRTNDEVGAQALELLEEYRDQPFFFFVHFADVDHKGHKYGENSAEYSAAIVSSDYWLGRIEDKLAALGLAESTLIYVTADHGFDEDMHTHKDAPFVFLGTNDPGISRSGMRRDITPTILDRFGVDLDAIYPPLDGQSLVDFPVGE